MLTWAQLLLKAINLINTILSWIKIQKAKQEGREEVVSKINRETEKFKDEVKKIDNPDLSSDDIADRLRRRYERVNSGRASVSGTSSNSSEGNSSTSSGR